MNHSVVLITMLLLAVVIGASGCSGEGTTPSPTSTPAPTPGQLSAFELSEPYTLPGGLDIGALEIYVDGTLWQRVERLSDFGPDDRVYEVVETTDGRSSIRFGDGEHGSRLPSRSSKVVAKYRLGRDAGGYVPGASPSPAPAQ